MNTNSEWPVSFCKMNGGKTEKAEFLKEQTECPLCEGKLDIFTECIELYRIKEEARCTQCMALLRSQSHELH